MPPVARTGIDVGCGDGVITRALARRGLDVLGIDVSPGMVSLARARTDTPAAIEYRVANVMNDDLPDGAFDVVVSVAMAHHLPLELAVRRLARLVAPGGVLLLQDVMDRRGLLRLPINVAAMLVRQARRLVSPSRVTARVAAAYHSHGAGEAYLDASMVANVYRSLLPSALVLLHLEWRYTVIWQPDSGGRALVAG